MSSKQVIDYQIIVKVSSDLLEKQIKILLGQGWHLQGGVGVSISESDEYKYTYYAQAIVKYGVPTIGKRENDNEQS